MKITLDYDGTEQELLADLQPRGVWPDTRLREWNNNGGILVDGKPYAAKINPASVDLAVSHFIRRPRWWWRNPITRRLVWTFMPDKKRDIKSDVKNETNSFFWGEYENVSRFVLWPGDFVLMSSIEAVRIPDDACALLRAKSTSGRAGLEFCDAGWGDSGFGMRNRHGKEINGCNWTLEAFNAAPWPIEVRPKDYYIQMIMFDLSSASEKPYGGRYAEQGIIPSGPRKEVIA